MLNKELLEQQLAELPLYVYEFIDPAKLEFSDRIRWICEHECPMYGKTWACPPAVGSVSSCRCKCGSYGSCLMISTIVEVADISDIDATLATRGDHETVTNQVRGGTLCAVHRGLRRMRPLRVLRWGALSVPGSDAPLRGKPRHQHPGSAG